MHIHLPQIFVLTGPLCCERWHGCSGPPVWPGGGCLVLPSDVVWELESCKLSYRIFNYTTFLLLNLILIKLMILKSLYRWVYNELKMLLLAPNSCVCAFGRCSYERICGSSVSIFCPVFLKICIAASATLSSSIFRHCSKDSYVSAEWNAVGWVKDKTWSR